MIVWSEQQPDFRRKPLEQLLSNLSFTAGCAIAVAGKHRPVVIVPRKLLEAIFSHLSEHHIEMGGLLIGNVHDLGKMEGEFVVALGDFARCDEFNGTGVSLQMGTAVWDAARAKLNGGSYVVGWYHSHPNLGAFFSGTDRRTQRAFFSQPYSIGLVIDPSRNDQKWFLGPSCRELVSYQILIAD